MSKNHTFALPQESHSGIAEDLGSMLPLTLLQAREYFMIRIRPILTSFDLTEAQWRALRVIYKNDTMDFADLSDQSFVQRASLTRVVKQLIKQGWATRSKNDTDHRQVNISITDAGRELVTSVLPQIEIQYKHLADITGDDELLRFRQALTDFVESVNKAGS